jgi:tetratricopeptide (TPR) repeat protein
MIRKHQHGTGRGIIMHLGHVITGSLLLTAMIASGRVEGRKPSDEDRSLARQVLAEASQETAKLPDYSQKEVFGQIATLQAEAGDIEGMMATINLGYPFTTEAVCTAGKRLTEQGKLDSALGLAARLNADSKPTLLYCIAEQLTVAGDRKRALEIAQKISSPDVKGEALGLLSRAYREAGDDSTADSLWKEGARLDPQRARDNDMELSHAAATARNKDAGGILGEAQKIKNPSARIFFLVDMAASKKGKGDPETAKQLLNKTQELAANLSSSTDGDIVRQLYVGMLAKMQEFDRAKTVIAPMSKGTEYQLEALSTLAVFQAEAGMEQEASQTASMILQQPVSREQAVEFHLDQSLFQSTMERIAVAQVNRGEGPGALKTLSAFQRFGIKDTLNTTLLPLTYAKGRIGDFEGAIEGLATLLHGRAEQEPFLSDTVKRSLQTLTGEMAAAGKSDAALAWARKQRSAAKTMALMGVAQGLLGLNGIPNYEFYIH